jgi:hypothetical protein
MGVIGALRKGKTTLEQAFVGCARHPFERAESLCRACRQDFCPECLVWPRGKKRPAMCIDCALTVSGVRLNNR